MEAAEKLDYERAASLRDRIKRLERQVFGMDKPSAPPAAPAGSAHSRPGPGRGGVKASSGRGTVAAAQPTADADKRLGPNPLTVEGMGKKPPTRGRGRRADGPSGSARQGRLKLIPDRPE